MSRTKKKSVSEVDLYIADLYSRFLALQGIYELDNEYPIIEYFNLNDFEDISNEELISLNRMKSEPLEHKLLVEFLVKSEFPLKNIWFSYPLENKCFKIKTERNNIDRIECLDDENNFYPLRDCDDEMFYKLLEYYGIEK